MPQKTLPLVSALMSQEAEVSVETRSPPPSMRSPFANVEVAAAAPVRFRYVAVSPPLKVEVELAPVTVRNPWRVEVPTVEPWSVEVAVPVVPTYRPLYTDSCVVDAPPPKLSKVEVELYAALGVNGNVAEMVTAPVAPESVMPEPATFEVTPELVNDSVLPAKEHETPEEQEKVVVAKGTHVPADV